MRTMPTLLVRLALGFPCERPGETLDTGPDLGDSGAGQLHHGDTKTLRWVLIHLIEETARHAGHADNLCEQLDGSTGR
jgi:hypothetical protein